MIGTVSGTVVTWRSLLPLVCLSLTPCVQDTDLRADGGVPKSFHHCQVADRCLNQEKFLFVG